MIKDVIIYNLSKSNQENFVDLSFSQKSIVKVHFINSALQLENLFKKIQEGILFFFSKELSTEERIIIRNILIKLPNFKICLCGPKGLALDAWKIKVNYFLPLPIYHSDLINYYRYARSQLSKELKVLGLKTSEGVINLNYNDIIYVKASGSYSEIYLKNGKYHLMSNQLHNYEILCENSTSFRRVHRSLIINTNLIQNISNQKVQFYGSSKVLEVSKNLDIKLKRIVLGKL